MNTLTGKLTKHLLLLAFAALLTLSMTAQPVSADDWADEASAAAQGRENNGHSRSHSRPVDNRPASERYAFSLPYANKDGYLSFKELSESEKPFVLVWWLSDCPVCHLQMPYVQKLQKMIDDGKVDIRLVTINIDYGTEDCLEYCNEKDTTFDVLHDARCRRTDDGYRIDDLGTPTTYIFKPGGELVEKISGWTSGYPDKVLKALEIEPPADAKPQE